MKNRTYQRDIIIKTLYQIFLYEKSNIEYDIDVLIKENDGSNFTFVKDSINGIVTNRKNINDLANKYLKDWTINRLSYVDQAIVSLGIYELLYTETPDIVCINEAIELAKLYSDDKVVDMINAVLDNIYHNEDHDNG